MADKYLYNNSGVVTEKSAIITSAGAGDSGKIPGLDASGRFDTSFMPVGFAADTQVVQASEALSAGDFVNIWSSSGSFRVRKADASTSGKEAHGYVLSAVSSAANATVYFDDVNTAVTSVTPGVQYLSDSVPGGFTTTAPAGTGKTVQRIGIGASATTIVTEIGIPIVLA